MEWTQHELNGDQWFLTTPQFSADLAVEIMQRMAADPLHQSGDQLTIHWCDGFIWMCVDTPGPPGANRGGYSVDIDEFWTAFDIEDLDEMDRVLSDLRERATQDILRLVPKHLPWVKRVERYEDTIWSEPDDVYEL